jgi:GntR family transcriptional regulator
MSLDGPVRQPRTGRRPDSSADDRKYVTISRDLRAKLSAGEYLPRHRLPGQMELARTYGVSIMTLRQALAELETEGLIQTEQGRGTYVATHPFTYRLSHLASFAQDMRAQGRFVTTRVLQFGPATEVEPSVCAQLALRDGVQPYQLDRVRFVDGSAVVFQRSYLSPAIGKELEPKRLETESLYDLLQAQRLQVVRAVESVKAVALPAVEAKALSRPIGTPAFLATRLSLGEGERPILFDRAYISGESAEIFSDRIADSLRLSFRLR